jgi:hypothetical protein
MYGRALTAVWCNNLGSPFTGSPFFVGRSRNAPPSRWRARGFVFVALGWRFERTERKSPQRTPRVAWRRIGGHAMFSGMNDSYEQVISQRSDGRWTYQLVPVGGDSAQAESDGQGYVTREDAAWAARLAVAAKLLAR